MRHFVLAALALPIFAAAVALRAGDLTGFVDARLALGTVHVLTLGWIAQTILGAWCQMIPVHGQAPLRRTRVLAAGWWLFSLGGAAYVAALWSGWTRYWIAASVAAAGAILELSVLAEAHARSPRRDLAWANFTAAFAWLAALAILGVLLARDRGRGLIFRDPEGGRIAHVHLALIGFVATAIYGAGLRLIPWVAMGGMGGRRAARASFLLTQAGLAGLALDGLFFGRRLMPLWACLLAAGFMAYAWQLGPMLDGGPSLNPSLAFTALAFAGGACWAAMGLGLAFGAFADAGPARAAYIWVALVGCATPMILAQVHKIAPFLVWLSVYAPLAQTAVRAPSIDELSSRRLAWLEFLLLAVAAPLGAAGLWLERADILRAGALTLLAGGLAYALNLGLSLSHLTRPEARRRAP